MFAQRLLNLQRRHLVPARLEDVNVRPAEDAINTVLDDRSIASAKPAIAEGIAHRVGLAPVFREHAWSTNFDLARRSRRCRLAVLADKLYLDARQWRPNAARHALAPQRVRQRHANLRHAVALQQGMAGDFLPALQRAHRQRCRARHHQAQLGARLTELGAALWRSRVPGGDVTKSGCPKTTSAG